VSGVHGVRTNCSGDLMTSAHVDNGNAQALRDVDDAPSVGQPPGLPPAVAAVAAAAHPADATEAPGAVAQAHTPPAEVVIAGPPEHGTVVHKSKAEHLLLVPLTWAEHGLHYAVGLVLVGIAAAGVIGAVVDMFKPGQDFWSVTIPHGLNAILFVVIVLEIFGTVISHFHHEGLQLRPFLIIGAVSGVRHILTVGAQNPLGGAVAGPEFRTAMIELGVNVGIVLGLVLALVIVARFASVDSE
jgi:uncharacterized membrane protein (DUF373 family)